MNSYIAPLLALLVVVSFSENALSAEPKSTDPVADSPVTDVDLRAFTEKWKTSEPFNFPGDRKHEPLLLAALKKDPTGPWVTYLLAKFARSKAETRQLMPLQRVEAYRHALEYLKPARETMLQAAKSRPHDKPLVDFMAETEQAIALATLEGCGDLNEAKRSMNALLAANTDVQSWNYGNIIYGANSTLGRIALREGTVDEAKVFLIAAGNSPGSPQLNSFGPDFDLARELLEKKEEGAVLEFLNSVNRFWGNADAGTDANSKRVAEDNRSTLANWCEQIRNGKIPDDPRWK